MTGGGVLLLGIWSNQLFSNDLSHYQRLPTCCLKDISTRHQTVWFASIWSISFGACWRMHYDIQIIHFIIMLYLLLQLLVLLALYN